MIEGAYDYASESLLGLLTKELRLMDRLDSIKGYFCMQRGDFF